MDELILVGKKRRLCKKTYSEIIKHEYINTTNYQFETIGYFMFEDENINGSGVEIAYIADDVMPYEDLEVGKSYSVETYKSNITWLMDIDEYYNNFYKSYERKNKIYNDELSYFCEDAYYDDLESYAQ